MGYAGAKRQRAMSYDKSKSRTASSFKRPYGPNNVVYVQAPRPPYALAVNEKKYKDTPVSLTVTDHTTGWAKLDTIAVVAQGDTESTRVGRALLIHSIHMNLELQLNGGTAATADCKDKYRIMLVLDKQNNATTHTAASIASALIQDNTSAVRALNSFRNLSNSKRFTVLREWNFSAGPESYAYNGTNIDHEGMVKNLEYHKEFKRPIKYEYNATTTSGSAGTLTQNNIFLIAVRQGAANTTIAPAIYGMIRVRFTD